MTDIFRFVHDRIDDDEATARTAFADHNDAGPTWTEPWSGAIDVGDGDPVIEFNDSGITRHIERFDPARVLAECTARRAVLDELRYGFERGTDGWHRSRMIVRYLATVYADHPDYRKEWKP